MSKKPYYLHHVNFPSTDLDRTREWYEQVFGMKSITPKSNTRVLLMKTPSFDLHFTPMEEMRRMAPIHFAIEVEDFDEFLPALHVFFFSQDLREEQHRKSVPIDIP